MKKFWLLIVIVFACSINLFADGKTAITIYNSNIGVVRETRTFDIQKGVSTLKVTDIPEKIDPTSVKAKFAGSILEQNYQYDLASVSKIPQRYIDKKVIVTGKETNVEGILISAGRDLVIKDFTGKLVMIPNYNDYKISVEELPEGLITKPTLIWMIDAEKSGKQDVEISYITNGMNWDTEYVLAIDKSDLKCDINAWVSLDNQSGATYKNVDLKLIAGEINRVYASVDILSRASAVYADRIVQDKLSSKPQVKERTFSDYHIYEMIRPVDMRNNESKQVSMFNAENVSLKKIYYYDIDPDSEEKNNVEVKAEIENKKENNLGMPFPAGKFRIFKDDGKSVELIGEDEIKHTPKDETIKLKIGKAFDVVAETKTISIKEIGKNTTKKVLEVKLKNRKDEDITIESEYSFNSGDWDILKSSVPYEKIDAYKVKFKVEIPKNSEKTFEFTFTETW
jgi:hypothetical protein